MKKTGSLFGWLALWWLWIPVVLGILYMITHYLMGGMGVQKESWDLWFNANIWHGQAMLWTYLAVGAIGTIVIAISWAASQSDNVSDWIGGGAAILAGILLIVSVYQWVDVSANGDKHAARFYAQNSTTYVPNISNPPSSVAYLFRGAHKGSNGCLLPGSDVPTCIRQGSLPQAGWEPRVSSASGALVVMNRTTGTTQNVDLLSDSLKYLNSVGKNGVWSAISEKGE